MPEVVPAAVSILPLETPGENPADTLSGREGLLGTWHPESHAQIAMSPARPQGWGHRTPGEINPTSAPCCRALSGAGGGEGQVRLGGRAMQRRTQQVKASPRSGGQVLGAGGGGGRRWVRAEGRSQFQEELPRARRIPQQVSPTVGGDRGRVSPPESPSVKGTWGRGHLGSGQSPVLTTQPRLRVRGAGSLADAMQRPRGSLPGWGGRPWPLEWPLS